MSLPVSSISSTSTTSSSSLALQSAFGNSDGIDCFSLSIDSAMEGGSCSTGYSNFGNVSLMSPLRKMDFALCKYRKRRVAFLFRFYKLKFSNSFTIS